MSQFIELANKLKQIGREGSFDVDTFFSMIDSSDVNFKINGIQEDITLIPITGSTSSSYIIKNLGSIDSGFGSTSGWGINDIVNYDTVEQEFKILLDASSEKQYGTIVFNLDDSKFYGFTGSNWTEITTGIGSQGFQGFTGPTGVQGFQGHTGFQGFQGVTGPAGSGKYFYGPTAPEDTAEGLTLGSKWFNTEVGGEFTYLSDPGNQSYWVMTNVFSATGPQGPLGGGTGNQGFQGTTGPAGKPGTNGNQGFQGPTGPAIIGAAGSQGFQGHTGFQGFQGTTGPTGVQGFQGHTGFQGFQGTTGPTGVQGFQGHTGFQGFQGFTGPTGFQGFQGTTGPTGVQGFQGVNGFQGFQGPTSSFFFYIEDGETLLVEINNQPGIEIGNVKGATGFQGFQGVTGPSGVQGFQGHTGFQGFQGTTGPIGVQGFQGHTGFQGFQGHTGFQGFQGVTGPAGSGKYFYGPTAPEDTAEGLTLGSKWFNTEVGGEFTYLSDPNNLPYWVMTNVFSATGPQGPQGPRGRVITTAPNAETAFSLLNGTEVGVVITTDEWNVYELDGTGTTLSLKGNIEGATGDIGLTGERGLRIEIVKTIGDLGELLSDSLEGDSAIVSDTGDLYKYRASGGGGSYGIQGSLIGPTGGTGDIGATGFQGFQGHTGFQGFQGLIGPTGFQGFQGIVGPTGVQGFQGVNGFQGFQGPTSSFFFYIEDGETLLVEINNQPAIEIGNVKGATGFQGFQGLIGPTGVQGFQGVTGPSGVQGFQGLIGSTGFQGFQGIVGPTGVQGFQGLEGPTGIIGSINGVTNIETLNIAGGNNLSVTAGTGIGGFGSLTITINEDEPENSYGMTSYPGKGGAPTYDRLSFLFARGENSGDVGSPTGDNISDIERYYYSNDIQYDGYNKITTLFRFSEKIHDNGSPTAATSGGPWDINLDNGTLQFIDLTSSTTGTAKYFSFNESIVDDTAYNSSQSFLLMMLGGDELTINWPSNVKFESNLGSPQLGTASQMTVIPFTYIFGDFPTGVTGWLCGDDLKYNV